MNLEYFPWKASDFIVEMERNPVDRNVFSIKIAPHTDGAAATTKKRRIECDWIGAQQVNRMKSVRESFHSRVLRIKMLNHKKWRSTSSGWNCSFFFLSVCVHFPKSNVLSDWKCGESSSCFRGSSDRSGQFHFNFGLDETVNQLISWWTARTKESRLYGTGVFIWSDSWPAESQKSTFSLASMSASIFRFKNVSGLK